GILRTLGAGLGFQANIAIRPRLGRTPDDVHLVLAIGDDLDVTVALRTHRYEADAAIFLARRLLANARLRPGGSFDHTDIAIRRHLEGDVAAISHQADIAVATGLGRRQRCPPDRKSTRLNSSHVAISYAVFCLKKKTPPGAVRV